MHSLDSSKSPDKTEQHELYYPHFFIDWHVSLTKKQHFTIPEENNSLDQEINQSKWMVQPDCHIHNLYNPTKIKSSKTPGWGGGTPLCRLYTVGMHNLKRFFFRFGHKQRTDGGFCTRVLNWVRFLEEATFSSFLIRPSTKALHKLCLGQLCQPQRP